VPRVRTWGIGLADLEPQPTFADMLRALGKQRLRDPYEDLPTSGNIEDRRRMRAGALESKAREQMTTKRARDLQRSIGKPLVGTPPRRPYIPSPHRLYESAEFSPDQFAPLGIPGNPLEGGPDSERMGHDLNTPPTLDRFGMKAPLTFPGRMESAGMTGVGGVPSATQLPQYPEQLMVPDVVSATDPAVSAHPAVQSYLAGLGRTPAASSLDNRDALPSAWMQWRSGDKGKKLSRPDLINGLNMGTRGLDLPYSSQGNSTIIR